MQISEQTKKVLKIVGGIAVVGVTGTLIYLGVKKYKKSKDEAAAKLEAEEEAKKGAITSKDGNQVPIGNDSFPLHLGSKGANVKKLQDVLVKKGWNYDFSKQAGYGTFGKQTLANVQKYFKKDFIDASDLVEKTVPVKNGIFKVGEKVWAKTNTNVRDFPSATGTNAGKILGIAPPSTNEPIGVIEKFSSTAKGWVYGTFKYKQIGTGTMVATKGWVNGFSLTNVAP